MKSEIQLLSYDEQWKEKVRSFSIEGGVMPEGSVTVKTTPLQGRFSGRRIEAEFQASGTEERVSLALAFAFQEWRTEDYLLVPAAVYDANRFRVKKVPYAPMFHREDYGKEVQREQTDPHR